MSSPVRLLLSSAPSRREASAFTDAILAAAIDEGLRARVVRQGVWSTGVEDLLRDVVGVPMSLLGADPVNVESWRSIPDTARLATWVAAHEALDDPECDLVIVDAGSLDDCRGLVLLPDTLGGLVGAMLTARFAMLRAHGAGDAPQEVEVFELVARGRARLMRWAAAMQSADCAVRIVASIDDVAEVTSAIEDFSMYGARVDGVCLRPVRKKDKAARVKARRLADAVAPVPIWTSKRDRPGPKGMSVMGPFTTLDNRGLVRGTTIDVLADADGFTMRVPVPVGLRSQIKVGVQSESLVLAWGNATRWLPLPPVLTRCRPLHARRTATGLDVRWEPAADKWPVAMSPLGGTGGST